MITFEQTQQQVAELKKEVKEVKNILLNKAENQSTIEIPVFLDKIVELTGYTKPTIYSYCQKNEIPYHKKNGRLFFFTSEIVDWIKEGKQKTITEIEAYTDAYLSNRNKGK